MQLTGSERLASGLACAFARPSGLVAPERHLDPTLLARLGNGKVGRRATDHSLRAALGFDSASFGPGFRERLSTDDGCALACRMALAAHPQALTVLRHLIANINQLRVRAALLKADRQIYREMLGEDAMDAALRPAPALASLAGLADASLPVLRPASTDAAFVPLEEQPLLAQAVAVIDALLAAQDPLLGRLWDARKFAACPPALCVDLTPAQTRAALRLLDMRLSA